MNTRNKFLGLLLVGILSIATTSCHRKGCIDPKANNYDSRSKKDDKSCTYDYEKFTGTYTMHDNCDGIFTYTLKITRDDADYSNVVLTNLGGWLNQVVITARVFGDSLSFDQVYEGVQFLGTGNMDSDNILHLKYQTFDNNGDLITDCTSESQ